MIISVGIDPSLTGFSWAALKNKELVAGERIESKAKNYTKDAIGRVERYIQLTKSVIRYCNHNSILVVIEGFAFGARGQGVTKLGELGGILRYCLYDTTPYLFEVAPKTMKKFAVGNGNANKLQVIRALEKRYGYEFNTDDEADAFCAAKIGECLLGNDTPQTKYQYEALEVIQNKINEDNPITFSNLELIRIDNTLK